MAQEDDLVANRADTVSVKCPCCDSSVKADQSCCASCGFAFFLKCQFCNEYSSIFNELCCCGKKIEAPVLKLPTFDETEFIQHEVAIYLADAISNGDASSIAVHRLIDLLLADFELHLDRTILNFDEVWDKEDRYGDDIDWGFYSSRRSYCEGCIDDVWIMLENSIPSDGKFAADWEVNRDYLVDHEAEFDVAYILEDGIFLLLGLKSELAGGDGAWKAIVESLVILFRMYGLLQRKVSEGGRTVAPIDYPHDIDGKSHEYFASLCESTFHEVNENSVALTLAGERLHNYISEGGINVFEEAFALHLFPETFFETIVEYSSSTYSPEESLCIDLILEDWDYPEFDHYVEFCARGYAFSRLIAGVFKRAGGEKDSAEYFMDVISKVGESGLTDSKEWLRLAVELYEKVGSPA